MKKTIFTAAILLMAALSCTGSEHTDPPVDPPGGGNGNGNGNGNGGGTGDIFINYYVAPDGSDRGEGTLDDPFATIDKALSVVAPGDTVLLRGGVYGEYVIPTVSGERGKVITLRSYPGERAVLDGSGLTFEGWSALVRISGTGYFTLEGVDIRNITNTRKNSDPQGIYISGAARNITVKDCRLYNIASTGELANDTDDWRSAHAILAIGNDPSGAMREITIEGCEIFEIYTGTSETLTLAGNIEGFTVSGNKVYEVENIGIIIAGGDNLAPGVDISVNYPRNGVVSDNLVYNCTHTKSPEVWGPDRYGAIGIYVCGGANTVVERNIVYGCDRGIGLVSESDVLATRDCIVRNNFVYNCNRTGIYMGDYLNFTDGGTSGCYVVNNTLFHNNHVFGALGEPDGEGELRLTKNCTDNVIKNNIVYARAENDIFVRKYTRTGSGNVIDYNHYYSAGNPKWIWDDVEYTDFEQWKAASGGDRNSVFNVDPLLVSADPRSPDLHIRENSPARDTGEFISAYIHGATDIDGKPRSAGGVISKGAQQ